MTKNLYKSHADLIAERDAISREKDYWEAKSTEQSIEFQALKKAYATTQNEVQQCLGKALGYPWYKDDPKNFPTATEADGVCTGEHVAESIAAEAAKAITALRELLDALDQTGTSPTEKQYQNLCDKREAARFTLLRKSR